MTELEPARTPEWVKQFERCLPWVEAALEYAGGTHLAEDVLAGIAAGEYQFWWHPDGCVVTEVLDTPRKRILHHWLAGGNMEAMAVLEAEIEVWARSQGCDRMTLAGRAGWARSFLRDRGYALGWTVLSKELDG